MAFSDFASVVKAGVNTIHVPALGSSFKRVKDGVTYVAIVKRLAEQEIPVLLLEDGENPHGMDWRSIERIPLTCPMVDGEWIVFPATGDATLNRYQVRSIHTDTTGDVPLWKNAVVTLNPG